MYSTRQATEGDHDNKMDLLRLRWFIYRIYSTTPSPHRYNTQFYISELVLGCILNQTFHRNQYDKDFVLHYPIKHTLLILVSSNSNFGLLLFFLFCLCRHLDLPTASQIPAFYWSMISSYQNSDYFFSYPTLS